MLNKHWYSSDSKSNSDEIDFKLEKLIGGSEHHEEPEVTFVKVQKSSHSMRSGSYIQHHDDDSHPPKPVVDFKEVVIPSLPIYENHPEHKITIVHMSDSHRSHQYLTSVPDGDIFIHSGDISHKSEWYDMKQNADPNKTPEENFKAVPSITSFNEWIGRLPHKIKIVILGNHDMGFNDVSPDFIQQHVFTNAIYLQDQQLIVNYKGLDFLKIYGTPWTTSNNMGFSIKRDKIVKKWDQIPKDTDILITHLPPFGVMDLASGGDAAYFCDYCNKEHRYRKHWGCSLLRNKCIQLNQQGNLRAHLFGHVHEYHGTKYENNTHHTAKPLLYSNGAAVLNHNDTQIKAPIVIELKIS